VVEEPPGDGDTFADQALALCRRAGVDVFVPGRNMLAVARRLDAFTEAGVRVQVSPPAAVEALAGKADTYALAASLGVPVPHTRTVTDLAAFRDAVTEIRRRTGGRPVCFKPDRDFGGHGFRILDEQADSLAALREPPSVRVSPATAERLLGNVPSFPPMIVSEYLDGDELSIDCLSDPTGALRVALPRSKGGPQWTRTVVSDSAATEIARRMVEGTGLRYLSNVQVRYRRGSDSCEPVLLEVNTRAASGLYQACRAAEVNLPDLALRMVLGEPLAVPPPRFGTSVLVYNEAMPFRRVEPVAAHT
jgi:biotin carboxylase